MKNFHSLSLHFLGKIFLSLFLLLPLSCNDPIQEELQVADPVSYQGVEEWQDLLKELELNRSIIVQQESSIQDAINAATPGDVIYIEPGVYKETLTIDKADIKLVGIEGANGEKVILDNPGGVDKGINVSKRATRVEVRNIKLQNFTDNSPYASTHSPAQVARHNSYFKMSRERIFGNIAYYEFEVRVGKRPFDVIRIRRFVRESRPYRPVPTQGEVFMVHGAHQNFEIFFRTGVEHPTPQHSVAVYLASKGIDVWGIDQAWTLVPDETTDFAFMKDWGVERDRDNTLTAAAIARLIRGFTGQGFGRMNLLGFSYGAAVAYAAAGRETQQYPILRDIKGLINVDQILKYASTDETYRQNKCMEAEKALNQLNAGVYVARGGEFFKGVIELGFSAPDEPSPFVPGFSNVQAGIFIGANFYLLGNTPPAPFWHFTGGNQPAPNVPATDLLFTDVDRFLRPVPNAPTPSFMPQLIVYEGVASMCDEVDVSFDDHFSEISLPIFYLGAEGGNGSLGVHTATVTASPEITTHIVSKTPERFNDFGHADLFLAKDAPNWVWEELRQWLVNHHAEYLP